MAEAFEIDVGQVTEDATMNSLDEWDSLNHLRLIVSIEEHFKVKLSHDDMVRMVSFQAILAVLGSRA